MSSEIYIKKYDFNKYTTDILDSNKYWSQRPIVYIINNEEEAYIWETIDASVRVNQHRQNTKRRVLTTFNLITTDEFNKSVILDLESFLISHMSADNKYKLQNWNWWLQNHNYYNKEYYQQQFKKIRNKLKELNIVKQDIYKLENSNLFKYSPYKSLTDEQLTIVSEIKKQLIIDINNWVQSTFVVKWWAGTGKTILWIYLMKLLLEIRENQTELTEEIENIDETIYENIEDFLNSNEIINKLKIGLVIPMDNLRKILQTDVFKNIPWLSPNNVLSPHDVAKSKEKWDILIVDEAHRLRQRKNLTQYKTFDEDNERLNLWNNGTELDWIFKKSKYQLFLYDKNQTIKPTDIEREVFEKIENQTHTHIYNLNSQLRCFWWDKYITYIKKIFSNNPPIQKEIFNQDFWYELKIFDDVNEMIEEIKSKNLEYWLCRNIAGYSRKWKTKNIKNKPKNLDETNEWIKKWNYDININWYKYIRNTQYSWRINEPNSINEIWCIHTTQWFDLNYTWLIIWNDLRYNKNKWLYADKKNYFDVKGKNSTSEDELLSYILNIYTTMCTRWMRWTYIYVCDGWLREYLSKFIDKA